MWPMGLLIFLFCSFIFLGTAFLLLDILKKKILDVIGHLNYGTKRPFAC